MFPQHNVFQNSPILGNALVRPIQIQYVEQTPICISLQGLSNERKRASGLGERDRILKFHYLWSANPSHHAFGFKIETRDGESDLFSLTLQRSGVVFSTGAGSLDDQLRGCTNRLVYQIALHAWSVMQQQFGISPDRLRGNLTRAVRRAHAMCIICGNDLATGDLMYRSTTCSPSCSVAFRRSPLEVRVPELHMIEQSPIFIHLWNAVALAIITGNAISMRPPFTIEAFDRAYQVFFGFLGHLAQASLMTDANAKAMFLRGLQAMKNDRSAERMLAWSSTHYRGCLVVSSALNLGNGVDFFLFTGNCDTEWAFAKHFERAQGRSSIVFHGTTAGRLYPILCDGLQYDASLIQTGRARGDGVYATNDSIAAMHYAHKFIRPRWMPSMIIPSDQQVLLVCELVYPQSHLKAWRDTVSGRLCDIYVVKDPSQIILRAVITKQAASPWPMINVSVLSDVIRTSRKYLPPPPPEYQISTSLVM